MTNTKSALAHYEEHLAEIYSWTVGGATNAIDRGTKEMEALGIWDIPSGRAVDLGAGFGMHALPLARRDWNVLAIDSSGQLLDELKQLDQSHSIRTMRDDILNFPMHLDEPPNLVLCMTDTLLHLSDDNAVAGLLADVARELADGGQFVITVRDYSTVLQGTKRFIPVRSCEKRIATCFLEYDKEQIHVHDIVYNRSLRRDEWIQKVGAYSKLRMPVSRIMVMLGHVGFEARQIRNNNGMVSIIAQKRGTGL